MHLNLLHVSEPPDWFIKVYIAESQPSSFWFRGSEAGPDLFGHIQDEEASQGNSGGGNLKEEIEQLHQEEAWNGEASGDPAAPEGWSRSPGSWSSQSLQEGLL